MADELAPFVLRDVEGLEEGAEREERQTGAGAYGYVFKVRVGGVERIAKKLHSAYVNQVSAAEKQGITSKFREECINLSKLRHPNVVQFIGVHYGRRGRTDLTLIMECVRSDMDKFLTTHPNIPLPLKLSILRDISFGLVYLHEYNPPIVHRDLHAKNILISDRCQAKIADVGVAKVVDIHAQLAASHTQAPGHVLYMPPEALKEKASCTPKLDIFSFGHLSLYTVNQEFPKVYNITLTMAIHEQGIIERLKRGRALDMVGEDHCLYPIITDCLFDRPEQRPTTRDLSNRLCLLASQYPDVDCRKLECKEELEQLRGRVSQLEARNAELAENLKLKNDAFARCHSRISQQAKEIQRFQENRAADEKRNSKSISTLKERIAELEETLEMTNSDNASFDAMLQFSEREKEMAREDLETAKKEISSLKKQIDDLQRASNKEIEKKLTSGPESEGKKETISEDVAKQELALLKYVQQDLKKQIEQLEIAKNEAIGDIAAAKMEAEIYKADFDEERRDRQEARGLLEDFKKEIAELQEERTQLCKQIAVQKEEIQIYQADFREERQDREKARGEVADLRKQKGLEGMLTQKESAALHAEMVELKQECAQLKVDHAESEAQSQHVIDELRAEIDKLKKTAVPDNAMRRLPPLIYPPPHQYQPREHHYELLPPDSPPHRPYKIDVPSSERRPHLKQLCTIPGCPFKGYPGLADLCPDCYVDKYPGRDTDIYGNVFDDTTYPLV